MATALGIQQLEDGTGLDPVTHRRIIKAHWHNVGIVNGLEVKGRSDLRYNVSAGMAVVSRSDSDGYAEAYWEGGQTGAVSTGDPSNPRIDTVWIKANDKQQGDSDNSVIVGVTQGTPSSSPVPPSLPVGCVALANMRVPAGATSTGSAQLSSERDYAIPYGSNLGLLKDYRDTTTGNFDTTKYKKTTRCQCKINVPTERLLDLRFTASVASSGSSDQHTNWYVSFSVDGQEVDYTGGEFYLNPITHEAKQRTATIRVSEGTHNIGVITGWVSGEACPHAMAGRYEDLSGSASDKFSGTMPGKYFEIWDRGPVS